MQFVISTHSFLLVVRFDKEWNVTDHKILSNAGHHYGIALHNDEKKHIICSNNGNRLLVFYNNDSFELFETIPPDGRRHEVHQIANAAYGIYIANTGRNSIIYQSLIDDCVDEYFFDSVSYDKNHVNSVFPYHNRLLVMLNNHACPAEVAIMEHEPGKGFTLLNRMTLYHRATHNIFIDKNTLMYNASADRLFVTVDVARRTLGKTLSFPGHTKGMSVTKDVIVTGFSDYGKREIRAKSRGNIAVIDRKSVTPIKTVDLNFSDLPHPVGNVNEIRCLSEPDYAHTCLGQIPQDIDTMKLAPYSYSKVLYGRTKHFLKKTYRRIRTGKS